MKWKIMGVFLMVVVVLGLLPVSSVAGKKTKEISISPAEDIWKTGHAEIVYQPGWEKFKLNFTKPSNGEVFHCDFKIPGSPAPALEVTYATTSSALNKSSGDLIEIKFRNNYDITLKWDDFQPFTLTLDIKNAKAVNGAEPPEGLHKTITLHFVKELSVKKFPPSTGQDTLSDKIKKFAPVDSPKVKKETVIKPKKYAKPGNEGWPDWLKHLFILLVGCALAGAGFLLYKQNQNKQNQKRKKNSSGNIYDNPKNPNSPTDEDFYKLTPAIIDHKKNMNHDPNGASRYYVKFDCEQPLKLHIPHISGQEKHMIRVGFFKFAANLEEKATFKIMSSTPRLFYFSTEDITEHQRAVNMHERENIVYINEEYTIFVNPKEANLLLQTKHHLIASWAFKNKPVNRITFPLELVQPEQPASPPEAEAPPATGSTQEKTATGSAAPGVHLTEETRSYIDLLQRGTVTGREIREWKEKVERISNEPEQKSWFSRRSEEMHSQKIANLEAQFEKQKLAQAEKEAALEKLNTELQQQLQDKEEQSQKREDDIIQVTNKVAELREELAEKEKQLAEKDERIKSLNYRLTGKKGNETPFPEKKEQPAPLEQTGQTTTAAQPARLPKSPKLIRLEELINKLEDSRLLSGDAAGNTLFQHLKSKTGALNGLAPEEFQRNYRKLLINQIAPVMNALIARPYPRANELLQEFITATGIELIDPPLQADYNRKEHQAKNDRGQFTGMAYIKRVLKPGLKLGAEVISRAEVEVEESGGLLRN